jgi:hypothetical protein
MTRRDLLPFQFLTLEFPALESPAEEAIDSIRKKVAEVATWSEATAERFSKLLQGVKDPKAKKLIKKLIRELRRGPFGVKP